MIGTSTGLFGAVWAQAELRKSLRHAGAHVLDDELPVALAADAFAGDGRLASPELGERLGDLLAALERSGRRGPLEVIWHLLHCAPCPGASHSWPFSRWSWRRRAPSRAPPLPGPSVAACALGTSAPDLRGFAAREIARAEARFGGTAPRGGPSPPPWPPTCTAWRR